MIISNYLQNVLPTSNVGNMLQDLNLRNLEKGQNPNLIHPRGNHETHFTLTGNSFIIHHCKIKQKQESYSHCESETGNYNQKILVARLNSKLMAPLSSTNI